jgi:hypothetical protein
LSKSSTSNSAGPSSSLTSHSSAWPHEESPPVAITASRDPLPHVSRTVGALGTHGRLVSIAEVSPNSRDPAVLPEVATCGAGVRGCREPCVHGGTGISSRPLCRERPTFSGIGIDVLAAVPKQPRAGWQLGQLLRDCHCGCAGAPGAALVDRASPRRAWRHARARTSRKEGPIEERPVRERRLRPSGQATSARVLNRFRCGSAAVGNQLRAV